MKVGAALTPHTPAPPPPQIRYDLLPEEHFRRCALAAAAMGLPVFPVRENAKSPPIFNDWPNLATVDRDTIIRMWASPDGTPARYNPAISTAGLAVVDIDIKGDGKAIRRVCEELSLDLSTYCVRTAAGGLHVYYRAAGVRCSVKKIHPLVDIRGEGGYVLAAGAVTTAGMYTAL